MSVTTKTPPSEVLLSHLQQNINSFAGVTELRAAALESFSKLGLPTHKDEEFRKTPITKAIEGFAFEPLDSSKINPTGFAIPDLEGYPVVFIDGEFSASHSVLPTAVQVQPIQEALQSHPAIITKHLGTYADYKKDSFVALNTAGWTNGLFVYVPENIVLDKPIIVYNIIRNSGIHLQRNLIVVEKNSELTIVEKTISSNGCFFNSVTEGSVDENSGLNYYTVQNNEGNHIEFNHKQLVQKNSSRVHAHTFTLGGKLVRNNLNLILDGSNCDSYMNGVYLLKGDSICDNHTIADHTQPHSQSNELYKGALEGKSKAVFNGRIYVRPQAQKTNAFQSNRNILLSEDSTIHTKPQLEIWADDVKCSHGCTSGQLDEEALFYLRTRGLGKDTAKAMLLYAFIGEVIDRIKIPALRSYVDQLVSDRLHKNF